MHQTGTGKKTGAGQIRHSASDCSLLLCRSLSESKRNKPVDVFSMLHAGNFRLSSYIPGIVLLVLILVGMFFEERFFCHFLCPMGAVFFSASDPAVLYSAPETRKLHPRLQRLHETVPVSGGTAIRWIRGDLRRLFPVPEMY